MTLSDLAHKKIAIAGMGVNNRKMADYFSAHGISFMPIDKWQSDEELAEKISGFDLVFRTPGLPYLSDSIQRAKNKGVEISSQTKLFFDLCPAQIIGVTGTKGKGTTTSLIYEILKQAKKDVYIAGNIGRDPFEFLDQLNSDSWVVMELSSFQLQDLSVSPHIAVVLEVTLDHMDHHQDLEEYIKAKSNILEHQTNRDFVLLHPNLPQWLKDTGEGQKIEITASKAENLQTNLIGAFNQLNIAASVQVAEILRIAKSDVVKAVANFQPLPHRLNFVRELNGVKYYDDGYSTNVEPVVAAVDSIDAPIVLIIGGYDKGLDFSIVGEKILSSEKVKAVVAIGQMTVKIQHTLAGFKGKIFTGAKNMGEIIAQAVSIAAPGDSVVFSPGTSSFDMFKNATDRAERFVEAVNNLK